MFFTRLINTIKCFWSYFLSLFGIVRVYHLPTFVSVEPVNYCQLHCPACPVGQMGSIRTKPANMSMELYAKILEQVYKTAHTIQFYFQGEPLLHPQLSEMIARAHAVGLYTIVSTNAQALTKDMAIALVASGLSRIIVSIDGFSQNSYETYRVGGSLDKALNGLRFLQEARVLCHSKICIEIQVLRLRTNEHEWKWIQQHYRELGGTRLVFKTAQLYNYQHGHPLLPSHQRHARYRKTKEGIYYLYRSWMRRHWFNNPCYRLWSGSVITTEGKVLPCCYDKSGYHSFGSLQRNSLTAIWHNETAQTFRRHVLDKRRKVQICQECNY